MRIDPDEGIGQLHILDLNGRGVQAEADLVEIRMMDGDDHIKGVAEVEVRGLIADFIAVFILLHALRATLIQVNAAARYIRKIQHVRVRCGKRARRGNHKLARVLVEQHLGPVAQRACDVKRSHSIHIALAVFQLRTDLLHRAFASIRKERRKLCFAVFAKIAVFQLAVAEQTDFFATDAAILLIEQSHSFDPPIYILFLLVSFSRSLSGCRRY